MLGLGFSEIVFLAILALVVVGPKQLPEVARTLGRLINELRRSTNMFTDEIKSQVKFDDFNLRTPPKKSSMSEPGTFRDEVGDPVAYDPPVQDHSDHHENQPTQPELPSQHEFPMHNETQSQAAFEFTYNHGHDYVSPVAEEIRQPTSAVGAIDEPSPSQEMPKKNS